jgi:hypothetical protein
VRKIENKERRMNGKERRGAVPVFKAALRFTRHDTHSQLLCPNLLCPSSSILCYAILSYIRVWTS